MLYKACHQSEETLQLKTNISDLTPGIDGAYVCTSIMYKYVCSFSLTGEIMIEKKRAFFFGGGGNFMKVTPQDITLRDRNGADGPNM